MRVNPSTLMFEDLDENDILVLRNIELDIREGYIPLKHKFIEEWLYANGEDEMLLVGIVLHIRILQSIVDFS
jgi:hypothetical protein